jgi:hypothetical protein
MGISSIGQIESSKDSKPHSTVQEIRQFMGLCNRFWSHATIRALLNSLTSKEANWKGDELPENCTEVFISLRNFRIS